MSYETSNPAEMPLLTRFDGEMGRVKLAEVIREQFIVLGQPALATEFAASAILRELRESEVLIYQDANDDDLYLILSGSFDILVNKRKTAIRSAGMHVGEMAAIDATSRRSSTVVAREKSLVAKIPLRTFESISKSHVHVWQRIAVELSRRLKERNQFHNPPRSQPVIFIGSTVEGLTVAREIQSGFTHDPFVVRLWEKGVFNAGATPIEDLVGFVSKCDFGIMVVTADDKVVSRRKRYDAPRDNIIFELGLLIGAIGRDRTIIVHPRNVKIKIPTDLIGVKPICYDPSKPSWQDTEVPVVCNEIRKIVNTLGPV
jgi:predicted nucleotide-binding protein